MLALWFPFLVLLSVTGADNSDNRGRPVTLVLRRVLTTCKDNQATCDCQGDGKDTTAVTDQLNLQLEDLSKRLNDTNVALRDSQEREKTTLNLMREDNRRALDKIAALESHFQKLNDANVALTQSQNIERHTKQTVQQENAKLLKQVTILETQFQSLESTNVALKESQEKDRNTIGKLQSSYDILKESQDRDRNIIGKLQSSFDILKESQDRDKDNIVKLQSSYDILKESQDRDRNTIGKLQSSYDILKESQDRDKDTIGKLQSSYDILKESQDRDKDTIGKLQSSYDILKESQDRDRNTIGKLQSSYDILKESQDRDRNTIGKLQEEIEELSVQNKLQKTSYDLLQRTCSNRLDNVEKQMTSALSGVINTMQLQSQIAGLENRLDGLAAIETELGDLEKQMNAQMKLTKTEGNNVEIALMMYVANTTERFEQAEKTMETIKQECNDKGKNLETNMRILRTELTTVIANAKDKFQQEVTSLDKLHEERMEQLRTDVKTLKITTDTLETNVKTFNQERTQLKIRVTALETTTGTLETSLEKIQKERNQIQTDVKALQTTTGTLETSLKKLQKERDQLKTDVTALQTTTDTLETSLETFNRERNQLKTDVTALETTTGTLETSLKAINQERHQLTTDVTALQTTTDTIETSLKAINQERDQLTTDVTALQTSLANVRKENVEAEIQTLTARIQRQESITRNQTELLGDQINAICALTSQAVYHQWWHVGVNLLSEQCPAQVNTCRDVQSQQPRKVAVLTGGMAVLCDTVTDGGGWIVFQRRSSGQVDFNRPWLDYKNGFGDLSSNFWLGNEHLHRITSQGKFELRIDLTYQNKNYSAQYDNFKLSGADTNYKLQIGSYSGTAGDSLSYHNHHPFTTYDNDSWGKNCAKDINSGGWWYYSCAFSTLNGVWGATVSNKGVHWHHTTGWSNSATFTEMKIRPV